MNPALFKLTPILVVGVLLLLVGGILLLKAIPRDSSGLEAGALTALLLMVLLVMAVDRLALFFLPYRPLIFAEAILLVAGIGWYSYSSRKTVIDCTANPSDYLVIIQTKGQPASPVFVSQFPFSRVATVPQGTVFTVNAATFAEATVNAPSHWQSTYSRGVDLTHPSFVSAYFYGSERYTGWSAEVESLVKQAIEPVTYPARYTNGD
ncbi:hypothetical protein ACAW74_02730 [Fibrella sp. WM1]|uniref:hypothetical protein n=1 Tax=Fibrella musci TaxID=3242485 RepID=UPI003521C4F2